MGRNPARFTLILCARTTIRSDFVQILQTWAATPQTKSGGAAGAAPGAEGRAGGGQVGLAA